jgi:hypothetical protein
MVAGPRTTGQATARPCPLARHAAKGDPRPQGPADKELDVATATAAASAAVDALEALGADRIDHAAAALQPQLGNGRHR